MSITLTLATKNAFSACAALASCASKRSLVWSSLPHLGEGLVEYVQLTPGTQCDLLSGAQAGTAHISPASGFCLILVQPAGDGQVMAADLLRSSDLNCLLVLQASWLGGRILPEWNHPAGQRMAAISGIKQALLPDPGWRVQEIAFGSLNSLWWGFWGGRILALHRPDLADYCNARMRRDLLPAAVRFSPVYLSLFSAVRKNHDLEGSINLRENQKKAPVA